MPNLVGRSICLPLGIWADSWALWRARRCHARQAPSNGERAKPEAASGPSGPPEWWGRAMPSTKGEAEWIATDCQRLGNPGGWNHRAIREAAGRRVFPSSAPRQGRFCKSAWTADPFAMRCGGRVRPAARQLASAAIAPSHQTAAPIRVLLAVSCREAILAVLLAARGTRAHGVPFQPLNGTSCGRWRCGDRAIPQPHPADPQRAGNSSSGALCGSPA